MLETSIHIAFVSCFVVCIFASIFSLFYKKPVRSLFVCFLILGLYYSVFPKTGLERQMAYCSLLFSIAYMLRGIHILAYQSKDIALRYGENSQEKKKWIDAMREMPRIEKIGRLLCLLLALGMISYLFHMTEEISFVKILLGIPFLLIAYFATYCFLGQMISPLFLWKKEKKIDIIRDIRRVNLSVSKNYISNVYLFFEKDKDVYAVYQNIAQKMEHNIGYHVEYEICTSILGVKFIQKMPRRIDEEEKLQRRRVEESDFQKHYYWEYYALEKGISSSLFQKEGRNYFFLGFFLACGAIGMGILLLYLLVDVFKI